MNHRVFIGGISGVGKTTLINEFCQHNKIYRGLSSSNFLSDNRSSDYYLYFDGLKQSERDAIRRRASLKIERTMIGSRSHFLVDGHFTAFNRITNDPEVCFNEIDCGSYTHLVLLDAEPEQVLHLRRLDKRRKAYSGITYCEIDEQLKMERTVAILIAERCDLNLTIIDYQYMESRLYALYLILL